MRGAGLRACAFGKSTFLPKCFLRQGVRVCSSEVCALVATRRLRVFARARSKHEHMRTPDSTHSNDWRVHARLSKWSGVCMRVHVVVLSNLPVLVSA
eukprot:2876372-Pleurochrysis_carterae.AAC.3